MDSVVFFYFKGIYKIFILIIVKVGESVVAWLADLQKAIPYFLS